MIRFIKNKQGQGIIAEYALTFFLVTAFLFAMSTYVRRTVQARVRGALGSIVNEINAVVLATDSNLIGEVLPTYEPYYASYQMERQQDSAIIEREYPAGMMGIIEKTTLNDISSGSAISIQLPPVNAD